MNEIRTNDLIDAFFNCDLVGDDRAALERTLLRSPQARELFWRKAEIHDGLREWGLEHWDRLGRPAAPRAAPLATAIRTAARTARAAALPLALLVGSLVGMGVAWAVVPALRKTAVVVPLRLANPGFETAPSAARSAAGIGARPGDTVARLPETFGTWTGDGLRICRAENGVEPVEGKSMLALERALAGPGDSGGDRADSCDLFQLVDLSAHRSRIARGDCLLDLRAMVIDAGPPRDVATYFVARMHVFRGRPADVIPGWPASRFDAVSSGSERIESAGGWSGWREIAARTSLPKDASFVLVQLDATTRDRSAGRGPAVFDRHYCDDIRLTLSVPSAAD